MPRRRRQAPSRATCPTSTRSTHWSPRSKNDLGGVDILINNAGRSIRRPLGRQSLERWHDVERTMALNYYSPLRLIRGTRAGHAASAATATSSTSRPGVCSASRRRCSGSTTRRRRRCRRSAGSSRPSGRDEGVHSTTLYYPLVATPMIAPTKAYDGLPALTSDEAADWMITAARKRPVRIAPRMAIDRPRLGHRRAGVGQRDHETANRPALRPVLPPNPAGRVIDKLVWRSWPAGCSFGRRTTSAR